MKKFNEQGKSGKNQKRREGDLVMSISEADIKKGWTEMEAIAGKCFAVPPKVDPNHESDLSDLFEWGNWVSRKCKLSKADSRRLLSELRKSKKK